MFNKKIFLTAILFALSVFFLSSCAMADSYKDYDEDVVRAYKKAKIKKMTFNAPVTEENLEDLAIKSAQKHFKKNKKIKKKPEIVLLDYEPFEKKHKNQDGTYEVENFIKINTYNLKNPEKFMFALNKETSRKNLRNRSFIKDTLVEDILAYSIISEKIEQKRSGFFTKAIKGTYNGVLSVIILTPKLGLGYLINPPLYWMKTNSPKDIYNNISTELEDLSMEEKEFKPVILISK